jgi:hypothetical protein
VTSVAVHRSIDAAIAVPNHEARLSSFETPLRGSSG